MACPDLYVFRPNIFHTVVLSSLISLSFLLIHSWYYGIAKEIQCVWYVTQKRNVESPSAFHSRFPQYSRGVQMWVKQSCTYKYFAQSHTEVYLSVKPYRSVISTQEINKKLLDFSLHSFFVVVICILPWMHHLQSFLKLREEGETHERTHEKNSKGKDIHLCFDNKLLQVQFVSLILPIFCAALFKQWPIYDFHHSKFKTQHLHNRFKHDFIHRE